MGVLPSPPMNEHTDSKEHAQESSSAPEGESQAPSGKSPGALAVLLSVVAAAFGVQSEKNRERDFSEGNPIVYIVAGLVFTVLFVLTLIGVVMLVLP